MDERAERAYYVATRVSDFTDAGRPEVFETRSMAENWVASQMAMLGGTYVIHRTMTPDAEPRPGSPTMARSDGYQEWRDRGGRLHREGGPAQIATWPSGRPKLEEWYHEGKRHREEGPAVVGYNEWTGKAIREERWEHGKQTGGD